MREYETKIAWLQVQNDLLLQSNNRLRKKRQRMRFWQIISTCVNCVCLMAIYLFILRYGKIPSGLPHFMFEIFFNVSWFLAFCRLALAITNSKFNDDTISRDDLLNNLTLVKYISTPELKLHLKNFIESEEFEPAAYLRNELAKRRRWPILIRFNFTRK